MFGSVRVADGFCCRAGSRGSTAGRMAAVTDGRAGGDGGEGTAQHRRKMAGAVRKGCKVKKCLTNWVAEDLALRAIPRRVEVVLSVLRIEPPPNFITSGMTSLQLKMVISFPQ